MRLILRYGNTNRERELFLSHLEQEMKHPNRCTHSNTRKLWSHKQQTSKSQTQPTSSATDQQHLTDVGIPNTRKNNH